MEFNHRANDQQASTYIPQSSSYSYFTEQALRGPYNYSILQFTRKISNQTGYSSIDFGRSHEFFQNPTDVHAAVQRELEKERIREEIIAEEIARKRILEAEVRREMMMEREMALRTGEGFSFLSSSSSKRFEPRLSILHQSEGRSVEERVAFSLEERLGYSAARRKIGGSEMLPFQRSVEPKISEVKPLPEVNKEKERVIFLAKPDANLSGAKRKAVTPPAVDASELPSVDTLKRKAKEEWSCALCQVRATSKQGLDEHVQGKKHKGREAGLRAQRNGNNFVIGLFPKKTGKRTKLAESTGNPSSEWGTKIDGELLHFNKTGEVSFQMMLETENKTDAPLLQVNKDRDYSKKKNGEAVLKRQKIVDYKKRFKYWCEMCQIGAYSGKVMNSHKKGKKHGARLQEANEHGGTLPATRMVEARQKVVFVEEAAKDGPREVPENVDEAVHGVEEARLQEANENGGTLPATEMVEATLKVAFVEEAAKDGEREVQENVDEAVNEVKEKEHHVAAEVANDGTN